MLRGGGYGGGDEGREAIKGQTAAEGRAVFEGVGVFVWI